MKTQLSAACLAALLLPSLAAADDYYLRAGAGILEPSDREFDKNQTWALGVGWRFNKVFSLEGGYNDLGRYSTPGIGGIINADVRSLEIGMAAKLAFGESRLFGQARAGAHHWENKLHSFAVSSRETGTDAYYGLGLGYDITDTVSVTVGYERYGWSDSDLDRAMVSFEIR